MPSQVWRCSKGVCGLATLPLFEYHFVFCIDPSRCFIHLFCYSVNWKDSKVLLMTVFIVFQSEFPKTYCDPFFKAIFCQNWHRVQNKFPLPRHYCWDSVDCDLYCSHFLLPCDSSVCLSHTDIRFVVPASPKAPFGFAEIQNVILKSRTHLGWWSCHRMLFVLARQLKVTIQILHFTQKSNHNLFWHAQV